MGILEGRETEEDDEESETGTDLGIFLRRGVGISTTTDRSFLDLDLSSGAGTGCGTLDVGPILGASSFLTLAGCLFPSDAVDDLARVSEGVPPSPLDPRCLRPP